MKLRVKESPGFTLIEAIAVLILISIMSAVAISKTWPTDVYRLVSEVETMKAHMRYAQFRAMSDDVSWGIAYMANSYTLLKNGAAAPSPLPNETSQTHVFQSGASITSGAGTVSYDQWGSPGASSINITLASGLESRTIAITQNTGYIP